MVEVTESDVQKANEAFDIAFSADPEGIDKVMTALFATHRIEAAKAERDRLRELPYEVVAAVREAAKEHTDDVDIDWQEIITALADALESQP